jgi:hypothetical protein
VESSCERGNGPSGSIKYWVICNILGNYRVAAQLLASRVVLSSTELVYILELQTYEFHKSSDYEQIHHSDMAKAYGIITSNCKLRGSSNNKHTV